RDSFRERRCLVPAQGFYEWKRFGALREPWLVRLKDGTTFAFGAVWDRWSRRGPGAELVSCALITTAANAPVAPIHGRLPVLIDRAPSGRWLDPRGTEAELRALMARSPPDAMEAFPVSARVNHTDVDEPELSRPVEPMADPGQLRLF